MFDRANKEKQCDLLVVAFETGLGDAVEVEDVVAPDRLPGGGVDQRPKDAIRRLEENKINEEEFSDFDQ